MELLVPYCIFSLSTSSSHPESSPTLSLLSSIRPAEIVKNKDSTFSFQCKFQPNWKLTATFYAILPTLRPIPYGMLLFEIVQNKEYPFNTLSINPLHNPFELNPNNDYMITYNTPILHSLPLYLYKTLDGVYTSFEDNLNYNQETLSPIFVLSKKDTQFECANNRCLPIETNGMTLIECINNCPKKEGEKKMKKKYDSLIIIGIIIIVCIIYLIITHIMKVKSRKK